MIDPATEWSEIISYKDKQAAKIENLVYKTCLYRYPRPKIITYDYRNKFLGNALKTI